MQGSICRSLLLRKLLGFCEQSRAQGRYGRVHVRRVAWKLDGFWRSVFIGELRGFRQAVLSVGIFSRGRLIGRCSTLTASVVAWFKLIAAAANLRRWLSVVARVDDSTFVGYGAS